MFSLIPPTFPQMHLILFCNFLLWGISLKAAPIEDEITCLPGLHKHLSFRQYSGYLHIPEGIHLHYWFVESQRDPYSSPVILWLNGGPGCSSLDGLLTEHGPFLVQPDGKTLKHNPYSWNMITNVIYLESPAGVGFSHSDDKKYKTNDSEVAHNNYMALKEFFHLFPEYSKNDLYIMGESYGGVYVPTLAVKVSEDPTINLKGIGVGNGLSSHEMNFNSMLYFCYYHGIFDTQIWLELQTHCCTDGKCQFASPENLKCRSAVNEVLSSTMSRNLNKYNIYHPCSDEISGENKEEDDHINVYHPVFFPSKLYSNFREKQVSLTHKQKSIMMGMPCINSTSTATFLNKPETRSALHIAKQALPWEICSEDVFTRYEQEVTSMEKQYLALLKKKYRILIYNGDVDLACNFLGNDWFVDSLNLELQAHHQPWFYYEEDQKQIGGFVRQFTNLTILTIKGAGHMAPSDKPNAVFAMFSRFIQNKPI